jgi:hypothetical protein
MDMLLLMLGKRVKKEISHIRKRVVSTEWQIDSKDYGARSSKCNNWYAIKFLKFNGIK